MNKRIFYIVDVFAERKYAGNQLAIFRDAGEIPDSAMQQIARETNYSETTFILSEKEKEGGYDVRIFTPQREVPFAGHPTLGTAFVIQKEIVKEKVQKIILNLKVGQIPVTFNYTDDHPDILWMKQKAPTFGQTFGIEQISGILNLSNEEIDHKFPIQEVSTGLPFIIVPLKSKKALEKAKLSAEDKSILVFCPETYERGNDLNARVFANSYGVPEDPATGSGNGCLAGYLVKHRYFGKDKIDIKVEQGYKIGRPSLLYLSAEDKKSEIEVNVGGKAVMIARGEFI
jgi:trans-2,3-dihydro-3-hydroxyanthranilate isomerase